MEEGKVANFLLATSGIVMLRYAVMKEKLLAEVCISPRFYSPVLRQLIVICGVTYHRHNALITFIASDYKVLEQLFLFYVECWIPFLVLLLSVCH